MTWIKICGTTSERDADLAIRAGANALGFIMAQSPRQVSDTAAYAIGAIVPKGVETIGVFVNEELETLVETARFCRFTGVQLHGDEGAAYISQLRKRLPATRIVKTLSAGSMQGVSGLAPDAWLIDNSLPGQRGGTGQTFNWRESLVNVRRLREPVIVAGGLTPQNVQEALDIFRPWGVDVASGVESYPGRKHSGAITQFIDAVRQHDARMRSTAQAQKG